MKWKGLRIPIIFLSLMLGLALLFGCQWLYQKYNYQQPLKIAISSNKAVQAYNIDDSGELLLIEVQMSASNLMEDYKNLYQDVAGIMGKKAFIIELRDNRDKALTEAYYNSQYAIYQAISRGTYQEMAAVLRKETGAVGAEVKVFIDQDNIYVHMKHNGHELNEIIARNPLQPVMSVSLAGGGHFNAQGN